MSGYYSKSSPHPLPCKYTSGVWTQPICMGVTCGPSHHPWNYITHFAAAAQALPHDHLGYSSGNSLSQPVQGLLLGSCLA